MSNPGSDLEPPYAGGCACGAVRYVISEPTVGARICHCRSCQVAMAGPFLAQASFARRAVTVTGQMARYRSSPRLWRNFCPQCGTRLLLEPADFPERVAVPIATLDDPQAIRPERHIWLSSALDWSIGQDDGLPRHEEASPVPYRPI